MRRRRGRRPNLVYLTMLSELREAYETGNGNLPFIKKFHEWAYEFNTTIEKVKSYQLKVRMDLAKEDICPIPTLYGRCYDGLKICSRDEEGQAEVDGDGVRDIKALKGKAVNVIIRQTARVNSNMLPPHRRRQHKKLIGRQAEQFVRLLEEAAQPSQRQ